MTGFRRTGGRPQSTGFALVAAIALAGLTVGPQPAHAADRLERLKHNNPGLTADVGVGLWAWPLPMDWDSDGDLDLVVSCPDTPYEGTYFFENPGKPQPGKPVEKMPTFKPAVRVGPQLKDGQISYVNGEPRVLTPATEWKNFRGKQFGEKVSIYPKPMVHEAVKTRENLWRYVDYDGDNDQDLIVGIADWSQYGWDDAYNKEGVWTNGPLHGYVYLITNEGNDKQPKYAKPAQVTAEGKPIDVFGRPSPNFVDFDGDGDLDLLCGEFLDGFNYFQNVGSRTQPKYAAVKRLMHGGQEIKMDLEMIAPVAVDWDGDGDQDLIVGDEDGRVAFVEHTGKVADGIPQFEQPRYFRQEADEVKFGALSTPVGIDWDNDGDDDIITGNSAGYLGFIENLGGSPAKWAEPKRLEADGQVIRIQAGYNGSIQGPAEAKWGYTSVCPADWDMDGLTDIVVNSIWGKIVWYRNVGSKTSPKLSASQPIVVEWPGQPPKPKWTWWNPAPGELVVQWRTTPVVYDWNGDKLNDLVAIDHEGYLALYRREKRGDKLVVLPGERVFGGGLYDQDGEPVKAQADGPLWFNNGYAGKSGRRKLWLSDWNGDGRVDLLINTKNAGLLENVGEKDGKTLFQNRGTLDSRKLAGHSSSPTTIELDGDGKPDLLVGAEDGFFYHMPNLKGEPPRAVTPKAKSKKGTGD